MWETTPMKRLPATVAAFLLLVGFALVFIPQQTSGQPSGGWVTLFNGTNLDNWNAIGDANWRIVEGAVMADKGNGFLVSKSTYTDFEIKAEFWVDSPANSGIFLRCTDPN